MRRVGLFSGLFVIALVSLAISASSTGIAGGEDGYLHAARTLGVWFDRVGQGDASFFDTQARDAAWSPVHRHVLLPSLISAFVWHVASSGYQWWGELVSLRLGFVLMAALGVALVASLLSPRFGTRTALFAAAFLAFVPRAMHEAVLADPRATTVTGWLLVLVCYMRARHAHTRRASLGWTLAAGVAAGLAVASSHGSLVVVLVPMLHTLWVERNRLRTMLREGLLPMPAALLAVAVVGPVVFYVSTPWLWHDAAPRVRGLFVNAFSVPPGADAYPSSFGVWSLVTSVPAVTLFAAALGLAVIAGPARLRAWARGDRSPDERTEGSLLVVALLVALSWPWVAPASMHASPPRWLIALPFVAGLAAVGLDCSIREIASRLRHRSAALRAAAVGAVGVLGLGVPLAQTLSQPASRSAAFTPLSGGPAWVAAHDPLPLHDGSPAVALAPAIDALGRAAVSIHGPSIPPTVWQAMRRFGMVRTNLRTVRKPAQADVLIVGPSDDVPLHQASSRGRTLQHVTTVYRDGVALLSMYVME